MASFLAGALKGLGLGGASPSKGADDEVRGSCMHGRVPLRPPALVYGIKP